MSQTRSGRRPERRNLANRAWPTVGQIGISQTWSGFGPRYEYTTGRARRGRPGPAWPCSARESWLHPQNRWVGNLGIKKKKKCYETSRFSYFFVRTEMPGIVIFWHAKKSRIVCVVFGSLGTTLKRRDCQQHHFDFVFLPLYFKKTNVRFLVKFAWFTRGKKTVQLAIPSFCHDVSSFRLKSKKTNIYMSTINTYCYISMCV